MLSGEGKKLIEDSGAGLCSDAGDFESLANNAILMSQLSPEELALYSKRSFDYYRENLSKIKAVRIIKEKLKDD